MSSKIVNYLAVASVMTLSACGGTGQDEGQVSNTVQVAQGLAIDGYLARSLVFLDSNNNGTRDAWEPVAFTDNEGYFSYNPLTQTNYCADDASEQEQQYCLQTAINYDDVILRIDGGYDVSTGEPFVGQLSRRVKLSELSGTDSAIVVTPLSSLLSYFKSQDELDPLLEKLGFSEQSEALLNLDYFDLVSQNRPELININLKLHKAVSILDDFLTDHYSKIGDEFGTPNDASAFLYRALAKHMVNSETSVEAFLANPSSWTGVIKDAESDIKNVYDIKDFSDVNELTDADVNRVINVVYDVSKIIDQWIDVKTGVTSNEQLRGYARALEVLTAKAMDNLYASDLANAIDFFTSANKAALADALISSLSGDNFDLAAVINGSFEGPNFASAEAVKQLAQIEDGLSPFHDVAGRRLKVSDLVKVSNPSDLEDKEFEFYFQGESGDLSGKFIACAKYIDDASRHSDGSLRLGEGNVEGERVQGFWSLLGANASNGYQSYSLLLTIDFLGATYQAIMKLGSQVSLPTGYRHRIRFDSDDGIRSWYSVDGMMENLESIPQDDNACKERLGLRL